MAWPESFTRSPRMSKLSLPASKPWLSTVCFGASGVAACAPQRKSFAPVSLVRVGDGTAVRLHGRANQPGPGEVVWLVGECRSSGERTYALSHLPADASLKRLAAAIKARRVCEQVHQQLKEELGRDHSEGRSWTRLHRHALMTLMAFAFSAAPAPRSRRTGKRGSGPP